MKKACTIGDTTFTLYNPRDVVAAAEQKTLYEVTVNPKTGRIKFSDAILARRQPGHSSAKLYHTREVSTGQLLILVRFVNGTIDSNKSNPTCYNLLSNDSGTKRNYIKAADFFKFIGLNEDQMMTFTAEPLLRDNKRNDVIFAVPDSLLQ